MATRSRIAKSNVDGSYTSIYCHWDGDPESQLPILTTAYSTEQQVDQLLALGDLSCLGREIGEKHDYDTHDKNPDWEDWCLAYGRDRGEDDTENVTSNNREDLIELADDYSAEYLYIFCEGEWEVVEI